MATPTSRKLRLEAASLDTAPTRLEQLAGDQDSAARAAVAENPNAAHGILRLLSQDETETVGMALLRRPHLGPHLLTQLASSPRPTIRELVASRFRFADDNLPWSTQLRLASDPETAVRVGMASTTNYIDVFERLLADDSEKVRAECAFNPRITDEHADLLLNDRRAAVRARFALLESTIHPTDDQLDHLARDRSDRVRVMMAVRVNLPESSRQILAVDPNAQIRHQIACRDPANTAGGRLVEIDGRKRYVWGLAERFRGTPFLPPAP